MGKQAQHMAYDALTETRRNNPAWLFLTANNAPLTASFLYREFSARSGRPLAEKKLLEDLEDYLASLGAAAEDSGFNTAQAYLRDWCGQQNMWLRRFLEHGEPQYALTASAQRALDWLVKLEPARYVGTESRLHTLLGLVEQVAQETDLDVEHRLSYLEQEKQKLQDEIDEIQRTQRVTPKLDALQVQERFSQAVATARELLSDFRQVEENFRLLEQEFRDTVIQWEKGKGALLDRIFEQRNIIDASEQGRSFEAFWSYLMNPAQQRAFEEDLAAIRRTAEAMGMEIDAAELKEHYHQLLDGAMYVQETRHQITSGISRYLNEDYLRQQRALHRLMEEIERSANTLRRQPPRDIGLEVQDTAAVLGLPFERPLARPQQRLRFSRRRLSKGESQAGLESLFKQQKVDARKLAQRIQAELSQRETVSLAEIIEKYPLQQGVQEYLAYLDLANASQASEFQRGQWVTLPVVDEERQEKYLLRAENIIFRREKA